MKPVNIDEELKYIEKVNKINENKNLKLSFKTVQKMLYFQQGMKLNETHG